MLAGIAQYEWMILEVAVLGFLFYQLWSVRRSIRHDREAAARRKVEQDGG